MLNFLAAQNDLMVVVWFAGGLILFILFIIILRFGPLWIQSKASNAKISFLDLIGMWLRNVNPNIIVNSRIMAVKSGLEITTENLESHFLARGNVPNVIRALIAAKFAGIDLTFQKATAIDLAGRDVLDAVQTSVNPKVIDCPDKYKGKDSIDAVAKDGIQVKAKARVTVRANLDRVVGGATEDTIIARVGEGIVTTIGSSDSYQDVLRNPAVISKKVLDKGLDNGTAFEILSIDIADVDVGNNIGARLRADQAEADKKVAQAKAEERRAMACATEQENTAEIQKNKAEVVLAEAEIPRSIVEALSTGKMTLMDYYNLRNVMADTTMRSAIAGESSESFKM
jgi:uncharacterized protein YqfA (UPF0365 family)